MFTDRPALRKEFTSESENGDLAKSEQLQKDLAKVRDEIQEKLLENSKNDAALDEADLESRIADTFEQVVTDQNLLYNLSTRNQMLKWVIADIIGHGPIEPLLNDPDITEIMVNGYDNIYVEKRGLIEYTDVTFDSDDHLMRVIDRIVSRVGRRIDESSPMVDARLPNGYRVNAIIPPLSLDGPILTVRKFATHPFTIQDLTANGTLSEKLARFLKACVEARINMVVSGGTGTGKTTLLNVLSSFIPKGDRVITIEDTAELQLSQPHVVRLEKRPPNIEGKGEVSIRQLVINALRMRPDRIVVGECRGGEALDMLQAMNTGHDGSMTTIHCNSPRDALRRTETMVLMAGMDLPLKAIREQVSSSIELVVHLARMRDGTRKIVQVSEVQGMESDMIVMQDLFLFKQTKFVDNVVQGTQVPTGIRPTFTNKMISNNIRLPEDIFIE